LFRGKARGILVCASLLFAGGIATDAAATNRLGDVESRGSLDCGIWPDVPGFAVADGGRFSGFDVDICRAVAAAIFGDATKVKFVAIANIRQFAERNDIDLVVRRLTWTLGRETSNGMTFGPVTFYDGQGFLVPKESGIESASELAGAHVCVQSGEHHAATLYNYFRDMRRDIHVVLIQSDKEAEEALRGGRCRAYSADISWLAAARSTFADGVMRYKILADQISKEPLAPLMRAQDSELVQLVRWTIYSLVEAEELGLSSRNIDTARPGSARVRSFLSIHPASHVALGAGAWVSAIISQVGNYGELFDRNLGADSPIKLDRALNRLWTRGGLMYAPPLDR
jgi:general L-amino acid transport system substrate-binding protein